MKARDEPPPTLELTRQGLIDLLTEAGVPHPAGATKSVLLRLLTLHREDPYLQFLQSIEKAIAVRTLESLARIELGAQGRRAPGTGHVTPHRSPGANAQLRRFCADLGRLLVASRPAEGYDEGPGAPKSRRVAKMGLSCAVWGVSGWFPGEGHRRALGTAPEDLSRASERIRRISRQMCRNRLLPLVVWVRVRRRGACAPAVSTPELVS